MAENINIRLFDAMLNYYMHLPNPKILSDEDWAEKVQDLHFIRSQEEKESKKGLPS